MGVEKVKKKEQIVEEYLSGGVTYRELGALYGVSKSTLQRWGEGAGGEDKKADKKKEKDASDEVKRLRRELDEALLYNELLNTMIDIAEEEMGVKIRKKRGAGQRQKRSGSGSEA